jgi:hypothetical protein
MVWNPETKRDECWHCGSGEHDTATCAQEMTKARKEKKPKRYKSVLAMVKDLSSPAFAKEFEKTLKKETVYVYTNEDDGDVEVFSELKLAKKFAEARIGEVEWEGDSIRGAWSDGNYAHIVRKKIVRDEAQIRV